MNLNYNEVPKIISTKDLDYLSDIFNWNYGAYKKTVASAKAVNEEEIKEIFQKASNIFINHLRTILEILEGGNSNGQ